MASGKNCNVTSNNDMWDDFFSGRNPTLEGNLKTLLGVDFESFKQEVNYRMKELWKGRYVSVAMNEFQRSLVGSDITVDRDMTGAVLIREELDRNIH